MSKSVPYLSREQSRKIDERAISEFGIPGIVLMENAARGCVDVLCGLGIDGLVCLCCGAGNNGGDGFAMARRLDLLGYSVKIFLIGDPNRLSSDAAVNFRILSHTDVPIVHSLWGDSEIKSQLAEADWIVDALLGTGFQGPLRQPLIDVIGQINQMPAKRFAVDVPSGLDCDTGIPADPTVHADHTCTFVAEKIGFRNPMAQVCLGKVHVVDIGAPRKLFESLFVSEP